ncbi:IS30 family transposase [Gemmatimonas sp.]|uniref:IS30 family transposase n=1 Tax=Gemmatimonas sp. TaxID=1962908 RepID=UPI00286D9BA3|nr:IS30 family transposase [Gemmatimonas sp.]
MVERGRPGLSRAEKNVVWVQYRAGASFAAIGRALGHTRNSIYAFVRAQGGVAPVVRRRACSALTADEREDISRGVAASESVRAIACRLGRAPSTISREIKRNGGAARYRARDAEDRAWRTARRPKPAWLAINAPLQRLVDAKLRLRWSPAQITGWLRVTYPDDPQYHVSHETIYRSLFMQARGALKQELTAHLRTRRPMRRSKKACKEGQLRGQIVDAVSIADRPASIEDRAIPGHWEGDLISGAKNSHIATLVERTSRYVHLVRVTNKSTTEVVSALIREVRRLPDGLMASLTWDRGHEMSQHHRFSVAADVAVYFCDPKSPWQRGTNENTNGLLRQYFPDGTDLSAYTQRDLDRVAHEVNTRPRKTLGFRTPAAIFAESVAPTR